MSLGQHIKTEHSPFSCSLHCWLPDTKMMQGGEIPPAKAKNPRLLDLPMCLSLSCPKQQGLSGQQKGHTPMPVLMVISSKGTHTSYVDGAVGMQFILPDFQSKSKCLPRKGEIQNPQDRMTQDAHPPSSTSPRGGQKHWLFHTYGPSSPEVAFTG